MSEYLQVMDDRKRFIGGNKVLCMCLEHHKRVLSAPSDACGEDRKLM